MAENPSPIGASQGLTFVGHPEPYPLVLRDGGARINSGNRFGEWRASAACGRRPCPTAPFRAHPAYLFELAEFTFLHVGEHIIHFISRGSFSSTVEWKRASRGRILSAPAAPERVSAVGSVAYALAYCQAVERAANRGPTARAKAVRLLVAGLEWLYNHLHHLGHLCHTTTLKVGEAQGKLLEKTAKQLNARLTGSRFLRGALTPRGLRRDLPGKWLVTPSRASEKISSPMSDQLDTSESHLDRLITTGLLPERIALDQGATGPIERASGLDRDLRRDNPYAHYAELPLP